MDIREKITRWIEEQGVTAESLAQQAGYSQSTLSFLLTGRTKKFAYSTIIKTARAMGTTVEALVDEDQGWPLPSRDNNAGVTLGEEESRLVSLGREIATVLGWPEVMRRLVGGPVGVLDAPQVRPSRSSESLRKRG